MINIGFWIFIYFITLKGIRIFILYIFIYLYGFLPMGLLGLGDTCCSRTLIDQFE